ncbi:MAG: hypothetical protein JJLCMIEE_01409 [Acidimicrobiales bacterium]|nr:hypothetical protein [Acidimicrobiales bacterium]
MGTGSTIGEPLELGRSLPPAAEVDWTDQVADYIVDTVDQVRARTTAPAFKIARGVVYGVLITFLAVMVVILLSVAAFRALDYAIPGHVWISYLVLGSAYCLVGLALWSRRGRARLD